MAITPRCEQRGSGAASSLTISLTSCTNAGLGVSGTAPAAGDFVAVICSIGLASQTVTQTGGAGTWTIYASGDNNGGGTLTTFVAYRIFDGTETNPTFSWGSSGRTAYSFQAVAPAAGTTLSADVWATTEIDTTASTSHTPNSATVQAGYNDISLILAGAQSSTNGTNAVSGTAPSGWSQASLSQGGNVGTASTPGYSAGISYRPGLTGTVTPGAMTIEGGSSSTGTTYANVYHVLVSGQPTYLVNGFENGTASGTSLTQGSGGNTGGAAGNFFDVVFLGSPATLAFDNTQAAHGSLSCKVATGASSATADAEWSVSLTETSIVTCWWRAYLYITALPSVAYRLVSVQNGSTLCAGINMTATGAFRVVNTSAAVITTSTTLLGGGSLPLSQWFRLEGFVNTATGTTELKIFASMDSTTATETDTSGSGQSVSTQVTNIRFGPTGTNIGPYWQDDLGVSDTAYLGPANYPAFLTGLGSLSAPVEQEAGASLAGLGAVSAPVEQRAGATLTGAGSLSPPVEQEAGATLTGAGAVASPAVTQEAGTALAGQGAVAAPVEQAAGASLAGQGTVTAPATQESGTALAGSGSLAVPGATEAPATLTGQGALTAAAGQEAGAPLTAAGSLTAGSGAGGAAALAGAGAVSAAADIPAGAPLTGAGLLAAPATGGAGAALAGASSVAAAGDIPGGAALAAAGSLTAHADTGAGAVLAGSGSLTVAGELEAGAVLAGSGAVAAPAEMGGGVTLAGAGTLLALAEQEAGAILAAAGFLAALGDIPGVAELTGHGSLTAGSSVLYPVPGTVEAADYLAATAAAGDWLAAAVSAGDSAAATTGAYDSLV